MNIILWKAVAQNNGSVNIYENLYDKQICIGTLEGYLLRIDCDNNVEVAKDIFYFHNKLLRCYKLSWKSVYEASFNLVT